METVLNTDFREMYEYSQAELASALYVNAERIEKILYFTYQHFKEEISIKTVAEIACMSVPAFCSYFKKQTGETYLGIVIGIRVHHACKLLQTTDYQISDIAFDSGFNTLANFHKQFLKIHSIRPFLYRNRHLRRMRDILEQNW